MNRAERRRAASRLPTHIRGAVLSGKAPRLDITPEELDRYGLTDACRTGSVLVIPGRRLNATRNGLEPCPKGQETPLRVNIVPGGRNGMDKA
jgi:hypothetical protein